MIARTIMIAAAAGALVVALGACRGKDANAPRTEVDAGSTSTNSGIIEKPNNSPDMTKSGTPKDPNGGDPPQIIPPEIAP